MSFGASPSDIIIVVTFCKALYRKCRDAGGEYDEISREVRGLHTVLRHLKYEAEAPESPLNHERLIWSHQLAPIIGDCDITLRQLDGLLQKYGRLIPNSSSSTPNSPRILWDKVSFGSDEMDTLGAVRVRLISHKKSLTSFLDNIQLHESVKMPQELDNHGGQLDIILDKVDAIAARMAPPRRQGSVLTRYEDDDREVWKQFRRELIAEGFSSDVLQQHKDVLRAYIREIDQKGLLDDASHTPPKSGVNPERWLEAVHTGSTDDHPPSFSSLGTATDDSGTKTMMIQEENMKFPQSMKQERPKPESRSDRSRGQSKQLSPDTIKERRASGNSQRRPSPVPRLITSSDEKDEKDVLYFNTSGSDSESDSEDVTRLQPEMGLVIRTSDLLASSQALTLRPHSPSSFRSSRGSFGEDDAVRSIAQRQRKPLEHSTSPGRTSAIAIQIPPSSNDRTSMDSLGTSPRPKPVKLAPDEHGNEIPADAKWTRINRRLVSPEVLRQDGRRYEARPEFVAVLGVLSRAEIESLAARSHALRQARQQTHSQSTPQPASTQAPPQPPRPTTLPIPMPILVPNISTSPRSFSHHHHARAHTPSSSSASDSEILDDNIRSRGIDARRRKPKAPKSYVSSNAGIPVSGYPNQYGSPLPPSPLWSPGSSSAAGWHGSERKSNPVTRDRDRDRDRSRDHDREKDVHRSERDRGEKGSERDRERERRRHSSRSGHSSRPLERRDRDRPALHQKNSKWTDHLTAAGIGGAAGSLLNILTEAAEGL